MGAYDTPKGADSYTDRHWRKRPRKDRSAKRVGRLSIRVTPQEYRAIKMLAQRDGKTLADYVVCRALYRQRRVRPSDSMEK